MPVSSPKRTKFTLTEAVVSFEGVTVDRDNGIIKNVKVNGHKSRNRRTYTEACHKDAVSRKLYEGCQVFCDHAMDGKGRPDPRRPRTIQERFGTLRNLKPDGKDLRGDLHFFKSHPMAETVCEAAERHDIGRFGLSHNVECEGERLMDGSVVVHRIAEVHSVDVVNDPATSHTFTEQTGRGHPMPTFREFLEAWAPKIPDDRRPRLTALLEAGGSYMQGAMGDSAPPMPDDDTDDSQATDAVSSALQMAVVALVEQAFSGDLDKGEAIKRIRKLFNTHTAVADPGASEVPEADQSSDKKKDAGEQYQRLEAALSFCEQQEYRPSKRQLEMLAAMSSDEHRAELLEAFKATAQKGPWRPQRPAGATTKSASPVPRPLGVGTPPTGAKELAQWLKG